MGAVWAMLLTTGGCSTIGEMVDSSDSSNAENAPAEQAAAAQELSPQERFNQILRLLEQGNTVAARTELIVYLQQKPDNETARNLLRQIDTPASEYFPADYRRPR